MIGTVLVIGLQLHRYQNDMTCKETGSSSSLCYPFPERRAATILRGACQRKISNWLLFWKEFVLFVSHLCSPAVLSCWREVMAIADSLNHEDCLRDWEPGSKESCAVVLHAVFPHETQNLVPAMKLQLVDRSDGGPLSLEGDHVTI